MIKTEELNFYHGTSVWAASAIVRNGAQDSFFEQIGAFRLGEQIWWATGLFSSESWRLLYLSGPGSESANLWVSALRGIACPEGTTIFDYGLFFATLNPANAYRHTIRNPYRSEFLLAIAESLKVLKHRDHPLPDRLATEYPEVARLLEDSTAPVVLELSGITRERLLTERGDSKIDCLLGQPPTHQSTTTSTTTVTSTAATS